MNILIIGLGSIARKHIAALDVVTGGTAHIYALRSSRNAADCPGVTSVYSHSDIEHISFDFAIISNPTSQHAEAISRLIDDTMPLMIEKPLFDTPVHDTLVQRITDSRRLTYVACNLRFLHALQFMKQQIDRRQLPSGINEVNAYCGSSLPSWRPGTDWRKCYSARPELGGGVHLDLIHELDYIYWLFGRPTASRGICRSASSLGIDAVDYANYCMAYPGFCASVILNYYRPDYRRTLEIVMGNDTWRIDLAANSITDSNGNVIFESAQRPINTYTDQMRYFTGLVAAGAHTSFNDIDTANEILKIATDYERLG